MPQAGVFIRGWFCGVVLLLTESRSSGKEAQLKGTGVFYFVVVWYCDVVMWQTVWHECNERNDGNEDSKRQCSEWCSRSPRFGWLKSGRCVLFCFEYNAWLIGDRQSMKSTTRPSYLFVEQKNEAERCVLSWVSGVAMWFCWQTGNGDWKRRLKKKRESFGRSSIIWWNGCEFYFVDWCSCCSRSLWSLFLLSTRLMLSSATSVEVILIANLFV